MGVAGLCTVEQYAGIIAHENAFLLQLIPLS
jgi:hypothetical protein